jgi:hypothetical protein
VQSEVATGLRHALLESPDEPLVSDGQRARLSACIGSVERESAQRDLARAFLAVDWLVRQVLPWAVEHHGRADVGVDLRALPELADSYRALCAQCLCHSLEIHGRPYGELARVTCNSITELVWADAAVSARSDRAHPLARQAEVVARSSAFSDPLDYGYLERAGDDVGQALREALSIGVDLDLVASGLAELWHRFA